MPPKQKKGKKKKVPKLLIGDVDISKMEQKELTEFAFGLKEKLEVARKARNFQQLERDKLRTFWDVARHQLEELELEIHELEKTRELETAQVDTETDHMKQAIKHVEYTTVVEMNKIKAETDAKIIAAEEAFQSIEEDIRWDIRELRGLLREQEKVNSAELEEFREKNREEIAELRLKHENELRDAKLKYGEQIKQVKEDMHLICRMEIFEVEERKNTHIENLVHSHVEQYNELKDFYNDITSNNLGLIFAMKEEIESVKKNIAKNERLSSDIASSNKQLRGPKEEMLKQLRTLKRRKQAFDRDREQLERYKLRNRQMELDSQTLAWEAKSLLKRNDAIAAERKLTEKLFHDLIKELQQGLHNEGLDQAAKELQYDKQVREGWLTVQNVETTKGCRQECEKFRLELNATLDAKNKQIEKIKFKAIRYVKAYDDLLATFQAAFKRLGITSDQIDFVPLSIRENIQVMKGPVGPLNSVVKE